MYTQSVTCKKLFDGLSQTIFASDGEGAGMWVTLEFDNLRLLSLLTVLPLHSSASEGEEVALRLHFSDGSDQAVTMTMNAVMQSFMLDPVQTSYIRVELLSDMPGVENSGFAEIGVYEPSDKDRYAFCTQNILCCPSESKFGTSDCPYWSEWMVTVCPETCGTAGLRSVSDAEGLAVNQGELLVEIDLTVDATITAIRTNSGQSFTME